MADRYLPGYEPGGKTGVLLVNLGTPDASTPRAVRRYLKEFLWDPRVVELPRGLWWPILHGAILPFRSGRAAKAYRSIWTEAGSPLLVHSRALADALALRLASRGAVVELAMRYGQPSIAAGLARLRAVGVARLVVAPLYPQYAAATTASIYDAVGTELQRWRYVPPQAWLGDYHEHPAYIQAVASSIRDHWQEHGAGELLLVSFHGLPAKSRRQGDPYYRQCLRSAQLIADALGLQQDRWQAVFQSRFGRAEWLKPYCVEVLAELPKRGCQSVDVVCPGFAVDCLETLEEIAVENRRIFREAGGEHYRYIPALNAAPGHADLWETLLAPHLIEG